MTFKPIIAPNDALGAAAIAKAVQSTLNGVAKAVKVDYNVTQRTWKNKAEFTIEKTDAETRVVSTDNVIYGYVEKGTKPHIIRPRGRRALTWIGTAYRAKTKPGVIGSSQGGNNNSIVYTKLVQHPGTAARNFTVAIQAKWSKEMVIRMEKALADAVASAAKSTAA